MIEITAENTVLGATYSQSNYEDFKENKNIFEEVIDALMLDQYSDEPELTEFIKTLPGDKKRLAILSLLDKDNNMWLKLKSMLGDNNLSKVAQIKDVVLMLREYVKIAEVEKKKFGEVMTPLDLVKEMLATLPVEVWSNPDLKWLDPANGTGPYPIMVIYKLMKGLEKWQPDEELRYKHIIENMIYVCELQPKNMFLYLCATDPKDEYNCNVYTGSFLEEGFDKHMKEIWDIENFDIVIGNPPYQDNTGKDGKTAATLWPRFLQKSIESILKIDGYLLFITPISWMSPGKQLIRNRSMPIYFKCNEFLKLNMDCGSYFNVGSYFSYYLIKIKNRYTNDYTFNETEITSNNKVFNFDFHKLDFIPKPDSLESLSIVNKVFVKSKKIDLKSSSLTRSDKSWVIKTKDDIHKYPIKHTNKEILWSSKKPDAFGIEKVIINSTGNFNPIYDMGILGTTQITRWVVVENNIEAINFISYLNSKIIKYVLNNCRWSGAASKVVFEKIHLIDISKNWTDEQLFQYFDITEEERQLVLNS